MSRAPFTYYVNGVKALSKPPRRRVLGEHYPPLPAPRLLALSCGHFVLPPQEPPYMDRPTPKTRACGYCQDHRPREFDPKNPPPLEHTAEEGNA